MFWSSSSLNWRLLESSVGRVGEMASTWGVYAGSYAQKTEKHGWSGQCCQEQYIQGIYCMLHVRKAEWDTNQSHRKHFHGWDGFESWKVKNHTQNACQNYINRFLKDIWILKSGCSREVPLTLLCSPTLKTIRSELTEKTQHSFWPSQHHFDHESRSRSFKIYSQHPVCQQLWQQPTRFLFVTTKTDRI